MYVLTTTHSPFIKERKQPIFLGKDCVTSALICFNVNKEYLLWYRVHFDLLKFRHRFIKIPIYPSIYESMYMYACVNMYV